MSRLARIGDGLRELQRDVVQLDRQLEEAARELSELRDQLGSQARNALPGGKARTRLALVDRVERHVRRARAQLQRGRVDMARWLAANDAEGEHDDGGSPPPPPHSPFGDADQSDAVYLAVHRANARRLAGEPADEALSALEAELAQLERDGAVSRLRSATAWQGERVGRRNAYADELRDPEPDATYVVEGAGGHVFQFETDARGRTVRARTTLQLLDQPRSDALQRTAKREQGGDAADDGGHLVGNVFGGPSEELNIVAQDWFQNQAGAWRALEREWQQLVADGFEVEVQIEPVYAGAGRRPVELVVIWAFRARGAPQPFEWVKDRRRIPNDHDAGPRPRGGSPPRRG